ncbi:hypothetical protein JCM10908_000215 [Rhodotorula pacifica]|uniref:uncharacterized protein n=1 Tax=Rhodotorula pacifica TaxID=1495444 RepID=UPI00316D9C45
MSTTDEEATSFFRRTDKSRLAVVGGAGGSVNRSASKWLPPPDSDDSSSDIEFVGTSSAVKNRATAAAKKDVKGKGKATDKKAPARKATTSKAAPVRKTSRLSSSSLDSSDEDNRMPTSGQFLPSATQIADSGATLRALAREKGWQGQSPPPRAKPRTTEEEPPRKRKQRDPSETSDTSDFGLRGARNVSTSTEQTTISDRSSSSLVKQRKSATTAAEKVKRGAKNQPDASTSTSRAKPRQKRASKAASPSLSPDPEIDLDNLPPPPESFWGVDTSLNKGAAAAKKHKHGEATNRLKSLSEQRAMLVLPDDDEPDDEIALADSGSSSAGEDARYEFTAAKSKREKEEALAKLKAKRGKLSVEPGAKASTPRAESREAPAARGKGKEKAVERATASCPLCQIEVVLDELEEHTNACLDCVGMDEDFEPTAAAKPAAPATAAGPSKSAFRPAGAAVAVPARGAANSRPAPAMTAGGSKGAAPANHLAAALFPSSPAQNRINGVAAVAATKSKKRMSAAAFHEDEVDDGEDEVLAISPAKKGKGRAPPKRPDGYLTSDAYDELPEVDASLNGTFIDLCAEDEDDDHGGSRSAAAGPSRATGGTRQSAGARNGGDGRDGAINSKFEPGPPADGSSPPRGSLYISELSAAYVDGYTRLYAKPEPKGKKARTSNGSNAGYDPDLDDSEAREFDALAPPPAKKPAGLGRGGRGGKRGGNRRGSWSWRAKARGRGGGGKRT